jgi:hypothetical protein
MFTRAGHAASSLALLLFLPFSAYADTPYYQRTFLDNSTTPDSYFYSEGTDPLLLSKSSMVAACFPRKDPPGFLYTDSSSCPPCLRGDLVRPC